MIICGITISFQCGTEFRIGPCRGTQFHFPSTLRNSESPILKVEAQKRNREE